MELSKTVATIEARMTSSRLPGKVLLPALGRPMLAHLVDRLKAVLSLDAIVLATTTNATDDVLAEFAAVHGIAVFRGSEDDVMGRVLGAAESAAADVIVEITGDCPIIDPDVIEQAVRIFRANTAQYVSNSAVRSYPDGMDVQVYPVETLRRSEAMTNEPLDREHVTRHIILHPELFPPLHLVAPPSLHWPELGLTLDELGDYELIKTLIEHFGAGESLFGCGDAIRVLRAHPEWTEFNAAVKRK